MNGVGEEHGFELLLELIRLDGVYMWEDSGVKLGGGVCSMY